jgi:hypothetical protein
MSYCVNCGVELAPSEKICPLCATPVINPSAPQPETAYLPYPMRVERIMGRIDRRYGAALGSLILLIPAFITMISDLLINQEFTWSPYVMGGLLISFVFILVPWFILKPRLYLFLVFDVVAVLFYLAYISGVESEFRWFLPLALPLTLTCGALAAGVIFAGTAKRLHGLYRPALMLFMFGVASIAMELFIELYAYGSVIFTWSLIVLAPTVVIAFMLILIERRQNLKDRIRRRLFI